jgi:hypothetical protein
LNFRCFRQRKSLWTLVKDQQALVTRYAGRLTPKVIFSTSNAAASPPRAASPNQGLHKVGREQCARAIVAERLLGSALCLAYLSSMINMQSLLELGYGQYDNSRP